MISGVFYSNPNCRSDSGIIGPPDGGGGIGIPVRNRFLQAEGPDGGPDGGPEGGPEEGREGGPEEGPEHDHEEPGPDERGPPDGEGSELATFDSEEDVCSASTASVLGKISDFDSSVAAVTTVSFNTFFDFTGQGFGTKYHRPSASGEESGTSASGGGAMSATTMAIMWGVAGIACGYGILYSYDNFFGGSANAPQSSVGFSTLRDLSDSSFVKNAMREDGDDYTTTSELGTSAHSRHALLSFTNKEVNYEEEADEAAV